MKSMYEKPVVEVTTVLAEPFMAPSEQGVISEDMAKKGQFEEEKVETGVPTAFTNIWSEEDED